MASNRLGPDVRGHWKLYFKFWMRRICKKAFDSFGEGSEFRPMAYAAYPKNIAIGRNVAIRSGCRLFADDRTFIIIGDDVLLGHGIHLYTNKHSFQRKGTPIVEQGYDKQENIILENGCWVGANSIVLPGVRVGVNAVVGAGSVVTKDVPDGVVVAGNPARRIKGKTEEVTDVERPEDIVSNPSPKRLFIERQKHS